MGGLIDADFLSVAWAIVAVVAGVGSAVAAITLVRRVRSADYDFDAGYNALGHVTH